MDCLPFQMLPETIGVSDMLCVPNMIWDSMRRRDAKCLDCAVLCQTATEIHDVKALQ